MSAKRTAGAAFAGSVLGQTRAARGLARLIYRLTGSALVGVVVAVLMVVRWYMDLPVLLRYLLAFAVLAVIVSAVDRRLPGRRRLAPAPVIVPVSDEARAAAHRVLYEHYEDDALPAGLLCLCGKPRVPGSTVYVGKSGRGLEQRTGEHADDKHWLMLDPPVLIRARPGFPSDDALAAAEQDAYDRLGPRENRIRPSAHASRR